MAVLPLVSTLFETALFFIHASKKREFTKIIKHSLGLKAISPEEKLMMFFSHHYMDENSIIF